MQGPVLTALLCCGLGILVVDSDAAELKLGLVDIKPSWKPLLQPYQEVRAGPPGLCANERSSLDCIDAAKGPL